MLPLIAGACPAKLDAFADIFLEAIAGFEGGG